MKSAHIIQRQVFELEVTGAKANLEWERNAAQYQEDVIAKGLEDCFDAIPVTDRQLIVEKLEIDLGSFSPESFKKEARKRLVHLLGERLQACFQAETRANLHGAYRLKPVGEIGEQSDVHVLDSRTVSRVVFLHFLEYGRFPWWYTKPTIGTTMESLFNERWMDGLTDDDRELLRYSLQESEPARIRVANHFGSEWVAVFMQHVGLPGNEGLRYWKLLLPLLKHVPAKQAVLQQHFWVSWMKTTQTTKPYPDIIATLRAVAGNDSTAFNELLKTLKASCTANLTNTSLAKEANVVLSGLVNQRAITNSGGGKLDVDAERLFSTRRSGRASESTGTIREPLSDTSNETHPGKANELANRRPNSLIQQDNGWFVSAAGLVLLHPFIPMLMGNLGRWQTNTWHSPEAVFQGVKILSYLSFGNTDMPEYQLSFHKLLMGMDMDAALPAVSALTPEETAACDELLHAVIGHWKALGNVSSASLQEGFLQREGKLELRDDGYHLQIEQQALDVLLARLPWGYATVKLPWMLKVIHTSWI